MNSERLGFSIPSITLKLDLIRYILRDEISISSDYRKIEKIGFDRIYKKIILNRMISPTNTAKLVFDFFLILRNFIWAEIDSSRSADEGKREGN